MKIATFILLSSALGASALKLPAPLRREGVLAALVDLLRVVICVQVLAVEIFERDAHSDSNLRPAFAGAKFGAPSQNLARRARVKNDEKMDERFGSDRFSQFNYSILRKRTQ